MVLEQVKSVVFGLYAISSVLAFVAYAVDKHAAQDNLISSVLAFVAYAVDKHAAQDNLWRVKESHLHLLALIGGWPGAWVAQKMLRHKTKKASFQVAFWVTVALNCATVGWILAQ